MDNTRRDFIKKLGAYVAPVIMTVAVRPAYCSSCYEPNRSRGNNGLGNGFFDGQPPGNPPLNDFWNSSPGNPGNKKHGK